MGRATEDLSRVAIGSVVAFAPSQTVLNPSAPKVKSSTKVIGGTLGFDVTAGDWYRTPAQRYDAKQPLAVRGENSLYEQIVTECVFLEPLWSHIENYMLMPEDLCSLVERRRGDATGLTGHLDAFLMARLSWISGIGRDVSDPRLRGHARRAKNYYLQEDWLPAAVAVASLCKSCHSAGHHSRDCIRYRRGV